jgi:sugar-specific transcriptional regulator TrmB
LSRPAFPALDFLAAELGGLHRLLRVLGIGKRELEIYMVLLTTGELTAKEISEKLNMPLSKVYDSLSILLEKRWVSRTPSRPSKYYASPIRNVWEDLKHNVTETITTIEEKIIPILEDLSRSPASIFRVAMIGKNRIPSYMEKILRESTSEKIRIAVSHEYILKLIYKYFNDKNINSRSRVYLLIEDELYKKMERTRLGTFTEVKKTGKMYGSGVIGKEILLIIGEDESLQGLWSDNIYIVELGKGYFDYIWSTS